jgi:hypothetical protein
MFYQEQIDSTLRFGDVIKGLALSTTNINKPILLDTNKDNSYDIKYSVDISMPLMVVLTPCCSIGRYDNFIALTPLIRLKDDFLKNPYIKEDFTRINRMMQPEQAVPPDNWMKISAEDKQKRLMEGITYASVDLFIYEENILFPKYLLKTEIETGYYMINFKKIQNIQFDGIGQVNIISQIKCLQLSVQTRAELRDKITFYYSRVPEEDSILLES